MVRKISAFINSENSVRGASLILIFTMTLSNVLGMLRDHFLAGNIKTSELDVYFAAFRIPDLIFNFLILGAITSAFIPVFCDYIAGKNLKEGWYVTNSLMNLAMIILIALAVVLFVLMPYLTPLVVPEFSLEKMEQTTKLSRLLMITPIFFAVSYILSGVLNSFKRFVAYSFAPIVYNLSIIFGAIFLGPKIGTIGVVYFVILGSFLHMMIQVPTAIKLGFRYRLIVDWTHHSVKKIVTLMLPRTVSMGVNQIMLIVYTALASALAAGSISAFNFANNIQTMPTVVFGTSFATAVFPTLTTAIAGKNEDQFGFYLIRSIRTISYLLIPITFIFILLRARIIRLILGSGQFNWSDTKITALTLGYFCLSLIAQGLIPLLTRAFYAKKNTKTPMYISIITVLASIVFGYFFAGRMGVPGLALAFSIGSFIQLILLYLFLAREHKSIISASIIWPLLKISLMSLIMAFFVWRSLHFVANFVDMNTFFGVFEQSFIAVLIGVLIYIGLSYLCKCEELTWAITRRVNGRREEK